MTIRWWCALAVAAAVVGTAAPATADSTVAVTDDVYVLDVTEPAQDIPLEPSPLANDTGTGLRALAFGGVPGAIYGTGDGGYTFEATWAPVGGKYRATYAITDGTATADGRITIVLRVRPPSRPPAPSFGDGPQVLAVAPGGSSISVAYSVQNPPDLLHRSSSYAVSVDGVAQPGTTALGDGHTSPVRIVSLAGGTHRFCATGSDGSAASCATVTAGHPPAPVAASSKRSASITSAASGAHGAAPSGTQPAPATAVAAAPAPASPRTPGTTRPVGPAWANGALTGQQLSDLELAARTDPADSAVGPTRSDPSRPRSLPVVPVGVAAVVLLGLAVVVPRRARRG